MYDRDIWTFHKRDVSAECILVGCLKPPADDERLCAKHKAEEETLQRVRRYWPKYFAIGPCRLCGAADAGFSTNEIANPDIYNKGICTGNWHCAICGKGYDMDYEEGTPVGMAMICISCIPKDGALYGVKGYWAFHTIDGT